MKVKDICQMVVCLTILIISSKLSFQIGIIALTLQTFAVAIISYTLKWKKASFVFLTYMIMGLIGIPVFSGGGGFFYILKPSFGFIIGFYLSAFIIGNTWKKNNKILDLTKGILGLLLIDIVGMIYMYFILKYYINSPNATVLYVVEAGFLPFILKDTISVVIAWMVALRLNPILESMDTQAYCYKNTYK